MLDDDAASGPANGGIVVTQIRPSSTSINLRAVGGGRAVSPVCFFCEVETRDSRNCFSLGRSDTPLPTFSLVSRWRLVLELVMGYIPTAHNPSQADRQTHVRKTTFPCLAANPTRFNASNSSCIRLTPRTTLERNLSSQSQDTVFLIRTREGNAPGYYVQVIRLKHER